MSIEDLDEIIKDENLLDDASPTDGALTLKGLDETIDGADLLDEVRAVIAQYVVLPSEEALVGVTLWVVATHAVTVLEHATRLAIHSPVKRCGKSRLLEVIAALVHHSLETTNISVPALFRVIESLGSQPPTLILDEADRIFGSAKKDEDAATLVALLNNGFRDGSPTWRCVGGAQVPTPFSNFAFAAIAGIGRQPDTIEDRAVNVTMRRRLDHEHVDKFRLRTGLPLLHALRDRIAAWVTVNLDAIDDAVRDESNVPPELEDRQQDAWESLIAVAVVAGGDWPRLAREAALRLTRETAEDDKDQSLEIRLLGDVRSVINSAPQVGFISTSTLLASLLKIDDAPWADFGFTARKVALRLGKFGIKPRRNPTGTERGYYFNDFKDAFARYIPSNPSDPSDTPPEQGRCTDGLEATDGLNRQNESMCQNETAGEGMCLTGLTLLTDRAPVREQSARGTAEGGDQRRQAVCDALDR